MAFSQSTLLDLLCPPPTLSSEPIYAELRDSRTSQDIIRLPRPLRFLQRPLANLISTLRAPKSMEGYAAIGGGSPLRKITVEQGEALQRALGAKDLPAKVYVGMRYWHPFTEEAIEEIKRDGVNRLVVLPLYPQFSITTSGSSLRLLERIFRDDEYLVNMQHTVIPSWYQRTGYVEAMTELIAREMGRMPIPEEVRRLLSPTHTGGASSKVHALRCSSLFLPLCTGTRVFQRSWRA